MHARYVAAVTALVVTSGLVLADPGHPSFCHMLPPGRVQPITLLRQPPPLPAVSCPPLAVPNIRFFKIEEQQPEHGCIPPPPPIRVFNLPTPCVTVCRLEPRCVNWFRLFQPAPCCKELPPPPPLRITHACQQPSAQLPNVCVPSVRIVSQPKPCGPSCK